MKKGFTLVELSIVLVIIGLLIGGILVGQSLIESAKTNSLIKQIQQFDIAILNFREKYKGIPGDVKNTFPNGGNGNGILEDVDVAAATQTYVRKFDGEIASFWNHLALSGFQPEGVTYSRTATAGVKDKVNMPRAVFGAGAKGKAGILPYNNLAQPTSTYWLSDFNNSTNTLFNQTNLHSYAYTPLETLALDSKFDDGKPSSGIVTAFNPNAGVCFNGTTYNNNSNSECMIFVRIASNIGGFRN